jgi:hypothetical protein
VRQNPAGGITVLPERGSLKTGVSQIKISKRNSVLIIHDRLGISGVHSWRLSLLVLLSFAEIMKEKRTRRTDSSAKNRRGNKIFRG